MDFWAVSRSPFWQARGVLVQMLAKKIFLICIILQNLIKLLFVVALDHLNIIVAAVIVYLLMVLKLQAFLVASYAHFSVKRII